MYWPLHGLLSLWIDSRSVPWSYEHVDFGHLDDGVHPSDGREQASCKLYTARTTCVHNRYVMCTQRTQKPCLQRSVGMAVGLKIQDVVCSTRSKTWLDCIVALQDSVWLSELLSFCALHQQTFPLCRFHAQCKIATNYLLISDIS